jgi:hypothetical protein|tara:strand:+ start:77 stop:331 length:255 start_codon:yes stop_codon:yes gene_type:complete
MKEHHQRMVEEARQWSEYHSKDAAKERSKQKRINKEKDHLFRKEKSKIQNQTNIEKINTLSKFLDAFSLMSLYFIDYLKLFLLL